MLLPATMLWAQQRPTEPNHPTTPSSKTAPTVPVTPTVPVDTSKVDSTVPTVAQGEGVVVGQVTDKDSHQPLEYANVVIVGTRIGARSDSIGQFKITGVPVGIHAIRVTRIGSVPTQVDSIHVTSGVTTTVNVTLGVAVAKLSSVKIASAPNRANSESSLLAMQKSSSRVSDGISAEAIKRAPGSNAGDAIVRVTGVSIVDKKFAVVRGLAERYSNTLLNGVELPSPEPLKKIVPLDLFPASLLQSIVVSKTATPDRPGDFAGGSVEVETKDFPDKTVADASFSVGYNSRSTLHSAAQLPQRGLDFLGFDSGNRRAMPANPPAGPGGVESERFAEQLPNVWTPAPTRVIPDFGASLNLGGSAGGEKQFGYVAAVTYSHKNNHIPDRFNQLVFDQVTGVADKGYVANENTSYADLGGILNFSVRPATGTKISLKNLYTRNAEEMLSRSTGFETYNGSLERLTYQARYITRNLFQTQLTGDHVIKTPFQSRLEWKATIATSKRDEPENRSLIYFKNVADGQFRQSASVFSPYWFRFLDDKVKSAQADWNLPLGAFFPTGSRIKVGGLARTRNRSFRAMAFQLKVVPGMSESDALALPPEEATADENIGSVLELTRAGEGVLPYESNDKINAQYAMLDLPLRVNLRFVGGLRREDWHLDLFQGTKAEPLGDPSRRHNLDNLWSGNLTWNLTDRQNIRLAGSTTVARPDPREISADYFVAVTGDCANRGNPDVQRTKIFNGDARWEFYPSDGELFSVSGFYKHFDRPIVELLTFAGSSLCTNEYHNIEQARVLGAEFEVRKDLTFLPGMLRRLSMGANLTLVSSKAELRPTPDIVQYLRFQGQSNSLLNLNLRYGDIDRGFEGTLLLNTFSDRIIRYGIATLNAGKLDQVPHVMERGRTTLDGKLQKRVRGPLTASLAGKNLTNAAAKFYQGSNVGNIETGYLSPGVVVTLGVGYAIH